MIRYLFQANSGLSLLQNFKRKSDLQLCKTSFQLLYSSSSATNQGKKHISLTNHATAGELAKKMDMTLSPVMKLLEEYGYPINKGAKTVLDEDIAEIIADEYGYTLSKSKSSSLIDHDEQLQPRPAVVTIMGHVDHGKTTLLDYLRKSTVAQNEAGGITQSIGAFSVTVPGLDDKVTFVDTPGHAAFNSMRARGAKLTDVVVLVIAADDGIMEQSMECLRHIKEAQVPLIIAINKIDKPNANPEKVKRELLGAGVQLEEFGGNVKCIEISALKGKNIEELVVLLNNFSKENNFVATCSLPVEAVVMEAESSKAKGIISTLLVKRGLLTKGKVLLAGQAFAKVRQLYDANGNILLNAGPSDPVQVIGWRSLPTPGDLAEEVKNEAEARNIIKLQAEDSKPVKVVQKPLKKAPGKKGLLQEFKGGRSKRIPYRVQLRADAASGVNKETDDSQQQRNLDIIIKADVSGSLEAIVNVITRFHSPDIQLNVIEASAGGVSINDLQMAQTFDGIIYSFNISPSKDIISKAETMDVSVRHFDIIYKLLDDLKNELENKLPVKIEETPVGEADVLKVFKLTGSRKNIAAGCHVNDGILDNSDKSYLWKVIRNGDVVHQGPIKSLKRGATDITIAKTYTECGVTLTNFEKYEDRDKILCVKVEKIKQVVDWNL